MRNNIKSMILILLMSISLQAIAQTANARQSNRSKQRPTNRASSKNSAKQPSIGSTFDALSGMMKINIPVNASSHQNPNQGRSIQRNEGFVMSIDPSNYDRRVSQWSQGGPLYEDNPQIATYGATHTHVYGVGIGNLTYQFSINTSNIANAVITARLSSEFSGYSAPGNAYSDVTLFVNRNSCQTQRVIPDNGSGHIYSWQVPGEYFQTGSNSLTFAVEPNAQYRNGLCIYYRSLTGNGQDSPIQIIINGNTQGRIERCFGGIGNQCDGVDFGPLKVSKVVRNPNGSITMNVSVGSILHDNCCLRNPDGKMCKGYNVEQESWGDEIPCAIEWRKAIYNSRDGRTWRVTFGPYRGNQSDDLTSAPARPTKQADSWGNFIYGYQWGETASTQRLLAPSGTALDASDQAFCASGQFQRVVDPGGGIGKYGICQSTGANRRMVDKSLIGNVGEDKIEAGCGCGLARSEKPRQTVLASQYGEATWMNIDGEDVPLTLASSTRPDRKSRKGDRFTEIYSANDIRVKIDYTVIDVGYEDAGYNAIITVTKGNRTQTIRAVGGCGC